MALVAEGKMSLRVLIVEKDPARAEQLTHVLENGQYDVLPLPDLRDASEVLGMQHFDAVLVSPASSDSELQALADRLRQIERGSRSGGHTAIVAYGTGESRPAIDAVLPNDFGALAFGAAMSKLAKKVAKPEQAGLQNRSAQLVVFDEKEFREQMCEDEELMVEIIDLYLVESAKQRTQMKAALASEDFTALSRVAHTIKGSLGSLHTPRARVFAQELETISKEQQRASSAAALGALEAELAALEPVLTAFRNR